MGEHLFGIDISAKWFDVADAGGGKGKVKRFPSDEAGITASVTWMKSLIGEGETIGVGMEATGSYHEPVARGLWEACIEVYVFNPYRVTQYAKGEIRRTKTDAVDARMIAAYTASRPRLHAWCPSPKAVSELRELVVVREQLQADERRLANRLHAAKFRVTTGVAEELLEPVLASVRAKLKEIQQRLKVLRKGKDEVGRRMRLLMTIPSVGLIGAAGVVARFEADRFKTRNQAVAYAALNPQEVSSGTSVHGEAGIGMMGSVALRRTLYMPAIVAKRFHPELRIFARHLADQGKPPKVVTVAVMRKLLILCWSMLRSGEPYRLPIPLQKEAA